MLKFNKRLNEIGMTITELPWIAVKGFINTVLILINCEVDAGDIVVFGGHWKLCWLPAGGI